MTIDWPWELVPDGIHLHVGQQFRRVVPGQRVALLPTIGFLDIFLFVLQSLQNFEKFQKVEKRAITFQPLRLCSRRNRSAGYNDAQKLLRPLTTPLPKSVEWLWHWFAGLVSWKKKKVNGSANLRLSFPLVKAARGPKKKEKKMCYVLPGRRNWSENGTGSGDDMMRSVQVEKRDWPLNVRGGNNRFAFFRMKNQSETILFRQRMLKRSRDLFAAR